MNEQEATAALIEAKRKYDLRRSYQQGTPAEARTLLMEEGVLPALDAGLTKADALRALGVTRQTLDRWIKTYEEEKGKP